MNLAGRSVVVTGGASGLGQATVARLRSVGANVASLDVADGAAAELNLKADVSSESEVEAAFQKVVERYGKLDVLVNCAGVLTSMPTINWKGPARLDAFEKIVRINLVGTFNCARLAAARMSANTPNEEGERGVIVNTSSIAAYEGQAGQSAYSATKAAIVGMTLPMARDLAAFGIRVVTIAPGIFDTPRRDTLGAAGWTSLLKHVAFPSRAGRPEEFASTVEHVISNAMLNGTTIRIDGAVRLPAN